MKTAKEVCRARQIQKTGVIIMDFSAFDTTKLDRYAAEAKAKWGKTDAYREYEEKAKDSPEENDPAAGLDDIMGDFAACMKAGEGPDSARAQGLVKNLQEYITGHYYRCTDEILAGLGRMYVADERFRGNIDRHADGTAAFISQAIACYCGK